MFKNQAKRDVDAVVVGYDNQFNYYKMMYAAIQIQMKAQFFATEITRKINILSHLSIPSVGALSKAIGYATKQEPVCVTKPNPYILQ